MERSASTASQLSDLRTTNEGEKVYNVSKSRLIGLINWFHVLGTYLPFLWFLVVGILSIQIVSLIYVEDFNLRSFLTSEAASITFDRAIALDLGWKTTILFCLLIWFYVTKEIGVFLLDFSVFEPPEDWKLTPKQLLEIMRFQGVYSEESMSFQEKLLERSGVGPKTAWPPGITRCLRGEPQDISVEGARAESQTVIFDVVRNVLKSTNLHPSSIDILVINCSLFSPTPSLCAMVINEFKMRSDISSYNLSGMGCSAGVISVELVKNLLSCKPSSIALIVSTENLTQNLYRGNERPFLVQNTLFRCGGAAIVLSNRWMDGLRSNFKLLTCVRTQYVTEDSLACVYETEDTSKKMVGVRLSKEIVKVAGRAMEKNFTSLGPLILPLSEQIKTAFWMFARFCSKKLVANGFNVGKVDPYIPDFKRGIDHFCIHAGGRGVIDGIEKNLNLTPAHCEASRHALYTYGNTSSSSIWYELDYIRKNANLKRGERVLQVAFGSGFKCNSCVWLCTNSTTFRSKQKSD